MNTVYMIAAADELDKAIFATFEPKERAELSAIRYRLRRALQARGIILPAGNEKPEPEKRADELTIALEDIREWIQTGKVDGVAFDEEMVIDSIRTAIVNAKRKP